MKVRPAVEHPFFWDAQFGYLQVWLFAESPSGAGSRASRIVEQLPYEIAGSRVAVYLIENPSEKPEFQRGELEARSTGLALFFAAVATGGEDEEEFEREDPP